MLPKGIFILWRNLQEAMEWSNDKIKIAKERMNRGGMGTGMKTTAWSEGWDCPQVWSLLIVLRLPLSFPIYQSFWIFYFYLHIFLQYPYQHTYPTPPHQTSRFPSMNIAWDLYLTHVHLGLPHPHSPVHRFMDHTFLPRLMCPLKL